MYGQTTFGRLLLMVTFFSAIPFQPALAQKETTTRSIIPNHILLFTSAAPVAPKNGPDTLRWLLPVPDDQISYFAYWQDNIEDAVNDEYWPHVFYFRTAEERGSIRAAIDAGEMNPFSASHLSVRAGEILQATTNAIDKEINRSSDIQALESKTGRYRLPDRKSKKENGEAKTFAYEPEKNGWYYVWLYVNSHHSQSVRTAWYSHIGSGCTRRDKASINVLSYKELPPEVQPWNSDGDVWRSFADSLKLANVNDVAVGVEGVGPAECPEDDPCPIGIAIHPKILNEMVDLWNGRKIPDELPISENP